MSHVVDASVALKWFVEEPDSVSADAMLEGGGRLIAPDLIFAEVFNAAWRLQRLKVVSPAQFDDIVENLDKYIDAFHPIQPLARRAAAIARALDHPVYDCFYLALAERADSVLVSADRRFLAKASGTPWLAMVKSLTHFEPSVT